METKMVDLMLENEQKNSADRIQSLEIRVQQQSDELICLKSALADLIRRMQSVEAYQHHQSTTTNSSIRHQPIISKSLNNKKQQNNKDNFDTKSLIDTNNSTNSRESSVLTSPNPSSNRSNRLSISYSNTLKSNSTEKISPTLSLNNVSNSNTSTNKSADASFNSEIGQLKFHLKGHPITFHLPTSNDFQNFDLNSKLSLPKQQLKLEWVYGYRGKDLRNNLYYLPTGEIIYCIASLVILYNVDERIQRFYLGHTDDVKAMAVHPDKITIATGQSCGHDSSRAHIRIWDSLNLNTLKIIGLNTSSINSSSSISNNNSFEFNNSISCLAFSKADGGVQLCAVDDGNEKWLSVWNWQSGQRNVNFKCSTDLVFQAEFSPVDKNLIVTCGKQHIAFWYLDGQHITKKLGIFESSSLAGGSFKTDKPKYILCISFASNELISGDSEGNILFWNTKECKINRIIREAHEGSIFSILTLQQPQQQQQQLNATSSSSSFSSISMITGGGKCGKLIEWNQDYQKTGRSLQIPDQHGMCRVIQNGKGQNLFLIGTTKNCVFQANFDLNYLNMLNIGHDQELWGLASNPKESHFLTCGNDKNLFYWDSLSHSLIYSHQFEDGLHCANIHPNLDNLAAIGCANKPKWFVFDLNERKIVFSQIEGTEQIECVAFSPNGCYLAVGSRDNYIYIYSVNELGLKYSRLGRCTGHSSFITHLDWSIHSDYLMSNSGDYEILVWYAHNCKQLSDVKSIRDLVFKTNTCTLSLNTLGLWSNKSMDGTDVNACASSISNEICCSVDDFGKVNLFQYPCNLIKAEKRTYNGHSSHVTNVTFINNDTRIITTGGNDMAILQWSINSE